MPKWIVLSLAIVCVDQLSKLIALEVLSPSGQIEVMPFLNFALAFNYGAAFSFLSDAGGWQRWFFIGLTLAVCAYILWLLRHITHHEYLQGIGFSLILGGAVGNLLDRIRLGYVIDFIDVYYQQAHFPTFNLADSAITIGAGLILLELFLQHNKTKATRS